MATTSLTNRLAPLKDDSSTNRLIERYRSRQAAPIELISPLSARPLKVVTVYGLPWVEIVAVVPSNLVRWTVKGSL